MVAGPAVILRVPYYWGAKSISDKRNAMFVLMFEKKNPQLITLRN
jgi:hypothetical protein